MDTVPLSTQARKADVSAATVRSEGKVPCVLYGNDQKNVSVECDYSEIYRAYAKAGESVIVDLDVNGTKVPSLFYEVQFDPVSDRITHVDFYAVDMKKEIEANIPIELMGESEAVKGLGAVLVTVHDTLTVKCLPKDLPQHVEVSIESLKEFGDSVLVSDVEIPSGVTVLDEPDAMIATVQEPRQEKEEEPEEVEGEGEGGEGEGAEGTEDTEGKKEEGGEEKTE